MSTPVIDRVNGNDIVAFVVELAVFALLSLGGLEAPGGWKWILGIGQPLGAAVLWALFAAPQARVSSRALRLTTKSVVLGGGVLAGFVVLPLVWAVLVATVVVINLGLMYRGPFARR